MNEKNAPGAPTPETSTSHRLPDTALPPDLRPGGAPDAPAPSPPRLERTAPLSELLEGIPELAATIASSKVPTCRACGDTGYDEAAAYGTLCACEAGQAEAARLAEERARRDAEARSQLFEAAGVPPEFEGLTVSGIARLADPGKAAAVEAVGDWLGAALRTVPPYSGAEQPEPAARPASIVGAFRPARAGDVERGATAGRSGLVFGETGPESKPGLILLGPYSVGKTGLLTAAYQALVARGGHWLGSLWIEFYDFVAAVQSGYGDGTADDRLRAAQQAPLLFIDDLGTTRLLVSTPGAPMSAWPSRPEKDDKQRILDALVSHRHREHLPTLATTNLSLEQLCAQFDGRIVERLLQACRVVRMGGRNLRLDPVAAVGAA